MSFASKPKAFQKPRFPVESKCCSVKERILTKQLISAAELPNPHSLIQMIDLSLVLQQRAQQIAFESCKRTGPRGCRPGQSENCGHQRKHSGRRKMGEKILSKETRTLKDAEKHQKSFGFYSNEAAWHPKFADSQKRT
jgi:hypothetical protein